MRSLRLALLLASLPPLLTVSALYLAWIRRWPVRRPFPRNLDELRADPAWLEAQLRATGGLQPDEQLRSFECKPFDAVRGLRSQVGSVRVQITMASGEERELRLVAKFAPHNSTLYLHLIYATQRTAVTEFGFYRSLARELRGRTPRFCGGDVHPASGDFCLLLEEVLDTVQYDEADGCPHGAVELTLEALARLHATFWARPANDWLQAIPQPIRDFLSLFRSREFVLSGRHHREIWDRCNRPQTVIHGDARVGNVLFPGSSGRREAMLFDWQATRLGVAAIDVAYFLILSVQPELRLAREEEYLRLYHRALVKHGVKFSYEEFLDDYHYAGMHLMQLFGLPFLSAEVNANDEASIAEVLTVGEQWARRGLAHAANIDADWLQRNFGIRRRDLANAVRHGQEHPHPLNYGAHIVAAHLRSIGGLQDVPGMPPPDQAS